MGYLCPDEVEEVPPVPSFAQTMDDFEIPPSDAPDVPQGHPRKSSHYQLTLLQPLEIMQRTMTKEEFIGFLKGTSSNTPSVVGIKRVSLLKKT